MKNKNVFRVYLSAYHNEVTGSRLLLVIQKGEKVRRILVDCGYFQEFDYRYLNHVDDINPESIDAILVTHNHIDHTGLIPKFVNQGYRNKIYVTKITKQLIGDFWRDCCNQQEENINFLRKMYPDEAYRFNYLFDETDIRRAESLCVGVEYNEIIKIFPDIEVTFFENGHILGASVIHVRVLHSELKNMNFLFTGDYKKQNTFFRVSKIPKEIKKEKLIMVCETTYGASGDESRYKCFEQNLKQAFRSRMNILIGAFAQGRTQEILYKLRQMQDKNLIPYDYKIYLDGTLAIKTTFKYQSILSWYNHSMKEFLPKNLLLIEKQKDREEICSSFTPKIIVTTSGSLTKGPARFYVPYFIEKENTLIHVTGYVTEDSLARVLLETQYGETIKINSIDYVKKATVKETKQFSSHDNLADLINFINQFENVQLLVANHGSIEARACFIEKAFAECHNVEKIENIDRNTMFSITEFGYKNDFRPTCAIKKMPAKLQMHNVTKKSKKSKYKKCRTKKQRNKKSKKKERVVRRKRF